MYVYKITFTIPNLGPNQMNPWSPLPGPNVLRPIEFLSVEETRVDSVDLLYLRFIQHVSLPTYGSVDGLIKNYINRIGGVTVSVLTSSAVDRGFEPRSGQTKYYQIGICCFSAKHAALRRKS